MSSPWPDSSPTAEHRSAYADAVPRPFWTDTLPDRDPHPPLDGVTEADLCIVGGGYTGLWAAVYAKEQQPDRSVAVLEATRCGTGASGRNGGFLQSSLTHGLVNGLTRFPDELEQIERLARENYDGLAADLERLEIDAEYEAPGDLIVAVTGARARRPRRRARVGAQVRVRGRAARPDAGAGATELAAVSRRAVDADGIGARTPRQARRRPSRRGRQGGRARVRVQPGPGAGETPRKASR